MVVLGLADLTQNQLVEFQQVENKGDPVIPHTVLGHLLRVLGSGRDPLCPTSMIRVSKEPLMIRKWRKSKKNWSPKIFRVLVFLIIDPECSRGWGAGGGGVVVLIQSCDPINSWFLS